MIGRQFYEEKMMDLSKALLGSDPKLDGWWRQVT